MSKAIWFWIIMALWLIGLLIAYWPMVEVGQYRWIPGSLMLFALLALLGWKVFGSPVQD